MPKKSTLTWVRTVNIVKSYAGGIWVIAPGIFFVEPFGNTVERSGIWTVSRGRGGIDELDIGTFAGITNGYECLDVVVYDLRLIGIEHGCLRGKMKYTCRLVEIGNGIEEVFGLDPFLAVNDNDLSPSLGENCGESLANKALAARDYYFHDLFLIEFV